MDRMRVYCNRGRASSEEVQLHCLVDGARNGSLIPAWMEAKAILSGSPIVPEVVDEEKTDEFKRAPSRRSISRP